MMSGSRVQGDLKGRFEYALRVLRLYSLPGPEKANRVAAKATPDPLKRGFEDADREYSRILRTIDSAYYHEFAVPAHIDITEETADLLVSSLQMRQDFPGVFGPEILRQDDKLYKVWIQVFPCG